MSALPPLFPYPSQIDGVKWEDNKNPAYRLFGKRYFTDQRALDLLAEFLMLLFSKKRVALKNGDADHWFDNAVLPPLDLLRTWPLPATLSYEPPVRLNLKLFAFFRRTPPDNRHAVHEEQYRELRRRLKEKHGLAGGGNVAEAIDVLEQLLGGLQGAGFDRVWSAQTFYPLAPVLLMQETIWNITQAKRESPHDWEQIIDSFKTYFSVSKHRFLAHGGEVLYLQLCNLFRTPPEEFTRWLEKWRGPLGLQCEETDLEKLHGMICRELERLRGGRVSALLQKLADFIEGLDPDTRDKVASKTGELECEYCAAESWPETYLFAIELGRLLQAALDPAERLELLMLLCALQVLRTLCAQSVRYAGHAGPLSNPLGYAWLFTPGRASPALRLAATNNLQVVQATVHTALRAPALQRFVEQMAEKMSSKKGKDKSEFERRIYAEADGKYGHKLLLSLGKGLGIIIPRRGRGARFLLNEELLRLLVLTVLPPGTRCTYPAFLKRVYLHYGIALDGEQAAEALRFSGQVAGHGPSGPDKDWPLAMLRAAGFLIELSDAFAIVENPFSRLVD